MDNWFEVETVSTSHNVLTQHGAQRCTTAWPQERAGSMGCLTLLHPKVHSLETPQALNHFL